MTGWTTKNNDHHSSVEDGQKQPKIWVSKKQIALKKKLFKKTLTGTVLYNEVYKMVGNHVSFT